MEIESIISENENFIISSVGQWIINISVEARRLTGRIRRQVNAMHLLFCQMVRFIRESRNIFQRRMHAKALYMLHCFNSVTIFFNQLF